jgi:hypothetical protein
MAHQTEPESLVANRMMTDEYPLSMANLEVAVHCIRTSIAQTVIDVGSDPCPMVATRPTSMLPY